MPRQIFTSVARPVRLLPSQRSSTSLLAYQLMMFIDKAVHIPGTVPAKDVARQDLTLTEEVQQGGTLPHVMEIAK